MGQPDSRAKHIGILIALFAACTLIYYFGELVNFFGWDALRWEGWYTVHDPHRILFLVPILYCTYSFGLAGALISNVVALLIFLPRALFISPYPDPALRMIIFVVTSTILCTILSVVFLYRDKRRKSPDRALTASGISSYTPLTLLLIFVFLSIGILIAGHFFYSSYEHNYRSQVEHQLSSIADLKASELIQWRKERIGDANLLFRNPVFSNTVQAFLERPDDTASKEHLRSWLYHYLQIGQYEQLLLLDTEGRVRMSVPDTNQPVAQHIIDDADLTLHSGKLTVSDLHFHDESSQPHMMILVPVFREKDDSVPLGVVALLIDPYRYLYPLISDWPTDSETAETLIVRRDGDSVLFLNDLKYEQNAALELRIPLTQTDVPAVKAVLGEDGIVEGIDYRGQRVIADIRYIPDSPWFMIARIDTSEVYAPLTQILWLVIALVGILLIGAGAGVGLVWRLQNIQVYQEKAKIVDALRISEERHRLIIDRSLDMIYTLDAASKFLFVSPASERIMGFKPSEMQGQTFRSFIHPDDVSMVERELNSFIETGRFQPGLEYRVKHASGGWRWHTTSGNRVLDENGSFLYFVGIAHDTTERRNITESLKALSLRYSALLAAIPDIITEVDTNKVYTWANPAATDFFGEDMIGKEASYYFEGEQDTYAQVDSLFRGDEKVVYVESWQRRKDGAKRLLAWWCRTLKDEEGNVTGVLSSAQDVTDQKQAERRIRESEALYRTLVETSPDAIGLMALDGTITMINKRAMEVFGFDPTDDLKGRNIMDFVAPENYDDVVNNLDKLKKAQTLRNWEIISYKKDGQPFYLDISSTMLMNEKGDPESILTVFKDITERKKMEKALRDEALRRRILVEQSRDGIVILDQNGKVYESNRQFAAMLGYTPEEMSQLYVFDWEFQFPREKTLEMIRTVDEAGDHFETRHRRKDGSTYDVEISTNAAVIEDQKLIFCVCRDITDRKLSEEKLIKSYQSLRKTLNDAINAMVKIVETRDPYTAGHQQNVADLATAIAREMKLEEDRVDRLRTAAIIHDIGKMYVPSDILSKPGKLSEIEYSLIKTHPRYGYEIVKDMDFHCSVAQAILQHHERIDGSGYPAGIRGDEIILEAKILVVADVVEAMAADRPYRPAQGLEKALAEISMNRGKLYDPAVVDACLELFNSGRFAFKPVSV
ncbi:MAG: PAS domain S-box protein [Dehalococcoidia bacterium]